MLAHALDYPSLADNIGNLALLARAADYGLLDKDLAGATRMAYREFRTLQHRERLQGKTQACVDPAQVTQHVQSVKTLWVVLLGEH